MREVIPEHYQFKFSSSCPFCQHSSNKSPKTGSRFKMRGRVNHSVIGVEERGQATLLIHSFKGGEKLLPVLSKMRILEVRGCITCWHKRGNNGR